MSPGEAWGVINVSLGLLSRMLPYFIPAVSCWTGVSLSADRPSMRVEPASVASWSLDYVHHARREDVGARSADLRKPTKTSCDARPDHT